MKKIIFTFGLLLTVGFVFGIQDSITHKTYNIKDIQKQNNERVKLKTGGTKNTPICTTNTCSYFTSEDGTFSGDCTNDVTTIIESGICISSSNSTPSYDDAESTIVVPIGASEGYFEGSINGLNESTLYYYRAYALTDAAEIGYGDVLQVTTKDQITNLHVTAVTGNSITLAWTNGSGGNRFIVATKSNLVSNIVDPTDGVSSYVVDNDWATGGNTATKIGTKTVGTYGIYNGTGNTVTLSGLSSNTAYYFRGYEYISSSTDYFVSGASNTITQTTLTAEPTSQSYNIVFNNVQTNQLDLTWTKPSSGAGAYRLVLAKAGTSISSNPSDGTVYTANTAFSSGDQIGSGNYVVYKGTGTSFTVTGLTINTSYTFKVFEFNGATAPNYLLTDATDNPKTQATLKGEPSQSSLSFSNVTSGTVDVSITRGGGDGVLVLAILGTGISDFPTDGTAFSTANSSYGTTGTELGNSFVVYNNSAGGSSFTLSGLTSNTTYTLKAFEYNNSGSNINYNTSNITNNPRSTTTALSAPTIAASNINFTNVQANQVSLYWTNGNGSRRIVTARVASQGVDPSNGMTINAQSVFSTGTNLGSNTYIVYDGTGEVTSSTPLTVTGLAVESTYWFEVFEYNGTGASSLFFTTHGTNNPASTATLKGEPTTQSTNLTFGTITHNSIQLNYTRGNGDGVLVLCKASVAISGAPDDGTTYTANSSFTGNGSIIGTSAKTVYIGTGNSVTVTNLAPSTTYYFKVFEYNNSGSNINYKTSEATGNPASQATNVGAPSTQESSVSVLAADGSLTFDWTAGNGTSRVAFINTTGTFSDPTDNSTYSANTVYSGSGTQCVYNNTGSVVTITGLNNGTTYYFKVFGYNGVSGSELYCVLSGTNTGNGQPTSTATWDGSSGNAWHDGTNWSTDAVPQSNYSVVIPTGISNMPIISTSVSSISNITIQAGATLTIANGGSLTVAGNATFQSPSGSGASGALVIPGTGTLSVSGTTTIQRYDASNNWSFYSVPVTSPSISVFNSYYVNSYNETSSSWEHLTSSSSIAVMQGISVKYSTNTNPSRNITFTGTLNNGNQSISVTKTSSTGDGWNLIGNPYASAIDWAGGNVSFTGGAETSAYLYNGTSYGYVNTAGTTTNGVTRYIPAMQGFFVHASSSGTVSLTNAARVSNAQTFYKSAENEYPLVRILAENPYYNSEAVVVFYTDASSQFDGKYDAYKKFGDNDSVPEIYTIQEDGIFNAINAINTQLIDSDILHFKLGIKTKLTAPVTFSVTELTQLPNSYVYLYDNLNEEYFNIAQEPKTFALNQETNDRFELVISKNPVNIDDENIENKIQIFTSKNEVFIKSTYLEQNNGTLEVFDIMGRQIYSKPTERAANQRFVLNNSGLFVIKVVSNQISANQIVIVN